MSVSGRAGLLFLVFFAFLVVASVSRPARAEAPNARALPVYVLDIDSDDAEDQAEALTSAIRSRVRTASGWSLLETNQSLSALIVALKCPPKPDAACLQRIADQLRADRFVWGSMAKGPAAHMVTADAHLWVRGKPEASHRESFSDNLKDQADDALRKIAARILEKVTGSGGVGTLVVQASVERGTLLVDGAPRAQLEKGVARVELPVGNHTIDVRATGYASAPQAIAITPMNETAASITLAAAPGVATGLDDTQRPFPVRKAIGWSTIGVGVIALGVGVVEGVQFFSLKSDLDDYRNRIPRTTQDVCSVEAESVPYAAEACRTAGRARTARTVGLIVGGIGVAAIAAGVVVLLTDPGQPQAPKERSAALKPTVRVLPHVAPGGASVNVHVTF